MASKQTGIISAYGKIFVLLILFAFLFAGCIQKMDSNNENASLTTKNNTATEKVKDNASKDIVKNYSNQSNKTQQLNLTASDITKELPEFIPSLRTYGGAGYDDFQINNLKELNLTYVQALADFSWVIVEPRNDGWKWSYTDEQMNKLAQNGYKTIPFLMWPKQNNVPWDEAITRNSSEGIAEFKEYAYEVVNRYHDHPAWSGLVAVWGGSSDVWDKDYQGTYPEVMVPLLNSAYEGIKLADPNTTVIGFNFATTATSKEDWEEFHNRAFALNPKFDWYGVQSHEVLTTVLPEPDSYEGMQGLVNVRKFLDEHGYSDKPLWVNEGGFSFAEKGSVPQQHAEQVTETFILGPTMPVNLKGWVYFAYFGKTYDSDDGVTGIMSALDQDNPPQPRPAWYAIHTLTTAVKFFDYRFDTKISGEVNQLQPYVLKFVHKNMSTSKLWVVFSPRIGKTTPTVQQVTINIAPATQATIVTMLGGQSTVVADASGDIKVNSNSSPQYILVS